MEEWSQASCERGELRFPCLQSLGRPAMEEDAEAIRERGDAPSQDCHSRACHGLKSHLWKGGTIFPAWKPRYCLALGSPTAEVRYAAFPAWLPRIVYLGEAIRESKRHSFPSLECTGWPDLEDGGLHLSWPCTSGPSLTRGITHGRQCTYPAWIPLPLLPRKASCVRGCEAFLI